MTKKIILFFFALCFFVNSNLRANLFMMPSFSFNNNQIFVKNQFIFSSFFSQNKSFNSFLYVNTITYKPNLSCLYLEANFATLNQNFAQSFTPLSSIKIYYAPSETLHANIEYSPTSVIKNEFVLPQWNFNLTKTFFHNSLTVQIHYVH